MAAKKTAELIPLCHPLGLDSVEVEFETPDEKTVKIIATARVHGRTGVEMEAMTAVSLAALTIYDMCKAVDREMCLGPIRLLEKAGGKSGHFLRECSVKLLAMRLREVRLENGEQTPVVAGDEAENQCKRESRDQRVLLTVSVQVDGLLGEDLQQVEQIFAEELKSWHPFVNDVLGHMTRLRGNHGSVDFAVTLRQGTRGGDTRSLGVGGSDGNDSHRHAGA